MLNVVARPDGVDYPAAILIRAIEPLEGLTLMAERRAGRPQREWANGPGRLTRSLGIDRDQHGLDMAAPNTALYLERADPIPDERVARGSRIGIHVPEPSRSWPWRLWVKDNPYVSRRK
jgi:DNA-3-methyladenine glycosylase